MLGRRIELVVVEEKGLPLAVIDGIEFESLAGIGLKIPAIFGRVGVGRMCDRRGGHFCPFLVVNMCIIHRAGLTIAQRAV